jgi:octanoyl-[GcvH]:protein N-octanoyltransferase
MSLSDRPRRVLLSCPPLAGGPAHDVALGPALLEAPLDGAEEVVRIHSPAPTAAFSRRDTLRPGFATAVGAVRRRAFEPVVRFPGGRLAVYHEGSVVVDHVCRTTALDLAVDTRFAEYAERVADVLRSRGVDARIGEVPGEYCPGAFSVNGAGVVKLAGSAQRVTRTGWVFSTVVQVAGASRLRAPLVEASAALGYPLELVTVGAVEDLHPGTSVGEVTRALAEAWTDADTEVVTRLPPAVLAAVDAVASRNALEA